MFEASARHENFSLAAREFNVTQPAISRMVTRLEQHLGFRLFYRKTTGLALTPEGKILATAVTNGLAGIEETICELQMRRQEADIVTISVTSAFAIHWLMPNFQRFRAALPEITLRLDIIHGEAYGPLGMADLGFRHSAEKVDELEVYPVVEEWIMPVSSPGYRDANGKIDGFHNIENHTFATLTIPIRVPWETYLQAASFLPTASLNKIGFSDYALVVQGAIKGQAIALGWWHIVANEILTGGLVPADVNCLRTGLTFDLIARPSSSMRPSVEKVRSWLVEEFSALEEKRKSLGLNCVYLSDGDKIRG